MTKRKFLKFIHLLGTGWFMFCMGFIIVLALHQAGIKWWVIFSLSGHSAILILLTISLYLFALFKGFQRNRNAKIEYPLTCSKAYMIFYSLVPFIGAFSGLIAASGNFNLIKLATLICIGTLWATFITWIFIDPLLSLLESTLPSSRSHRKKRLVVSRKWKYQKEKQKRKLIYELKQKQKIKAITLEEHFLSASQELYNLITMDKRLPDHARERITDIGVDAWRIGGLDCMKKLHDSVNSKYETKSDHDLKCDYVDLQWDGIGTWQCKHI